MSYSEEVQELLNRITFTCRQYPTQKDMDRRLSFATIRTAADTIAALSDDELSSKHAEQVRVQVQAIGSALDQLNEQFGSDASDRCRVCAAVLEQTSLGGGQYLRWCTRCPQPILQAVAEIEDLL